MKRLALALVAAFAFHATPARSQSTLVFGEGTPPALELKIVSGSVASGCGRESALVKCLLVDTDQVAPVMQGYSEQLRALGWSRASMSGAAPGTLAFVSDVPRPESPNCGSLLLVVPSRTGQTNAPAGKAQFSLGLIPGSPCPASDSEGAAP